MQTSVGHTVSWRATSLWMVAVVICAVGVTGAIALPRLAHAEVTLATLPDAKSGKTTRLHVDATLEGFLAYDANRPADGAIPGRLFDPRHGELGLSNVMVGLSAERGPTSGRIAIWRGWTPSVVYSGEPAGAVDWSLLQEAWGQVKATEKLSFSGGLFSSPIGLESTFARDNWCWSSSHLNLAMPFYHTGARAQWRATEATTVEAGLYSGWTRNVSSNIPSTFIVRAFGSKRWGTWQVLATGAPSRPGISTAGVGPVRGWLVDAYATAAMNDEVEFAAQGQVGAETWKSTTKGAQMSPWAAATLYARYRIVPPIHVTARAEVFWQSDTTEVVQGETLGRLWWPTSMLSAITLSFEYRPVDSLMLRIDLRTDSAAEPMFLRHDRTLTDTRPTVSMGLAWTL